MPNPSNRSSFDPNVTERAGILAGGNFITDYVKIIDHWPEQDTLASIQSESMSNGGGPYNVLKDIAVLAPNIPRAAIGLLGEDSNGDWIVSDCENSDIDATGLRRTSLGWTSYTDAMTDAKTGRRTFFHQRGTNSLLKPEDFKFEQTNAKIFLLGYLLLLDELDRFSDSVVVEDSGSMTGAAQVLKSARDSGLIAAVDCVSQPHPQFREIVISSLRQTDILFINEFEIGQVLGRSVASQKDAMIEAATELLAEAKLESTQIVLHAATGAVVASAEGIFSQAAINFPNSEIAGASGAGDAFAAGYLIGVHQAESVQERLEFAVCAAAQSLTNPTPSGGTQPLETCLALKSKFGFQTFA